MARTCIITSYAGIEAERLHDPAASEALSQEDFDNAYETSVSYEVFPRGCSYVGDDVHLQYLLRLRGEAHRLVRRHRVEIERMAKALSNRGTLTGEEARTILASPKRRDDPR